MTAPLTREELAEELATYRHDRDTTAERILAHDYALRAALAEREGELTNRDRALAYARVVRIERERNAAIADAERLRANLSAWHATNSGLEIKAERDAALAEVERLTANFVDLTKRMAAEMRESTELRARLRSYPEIPDSLSAALARERALRDGLQALFDACAEVKLARDTKGSLIDLVDAHGQARALLTTAGAGEETK